MASLVSVGDDEVASTNPGNHPGPDNFDLYLPWACQQLQLDLEIMIVNILSKFTDTKSTKSKQSLAKSKPKKSDTFSDQDSIMSVSLNKQPTIHNENVIKIYTVYDNNGNLVQLKFDQNKNVPRRVLKIVGLIIQFHKYLTGITINRGLNKGCLLELNILGSHANITDICLDNTSIGDGGYEILLEGKNNLRQLSLSRCKIEDDTLKNIASKLVHPLPASQTLSILNLASNSVTDKGAKHLGLALRSNRTLAYLNISDNSITDEGAGAILDALIEFRLSDEEIVESRRRTFRYLREKEELIAKLIIELKSADTEKKLLKKKSTKPTGAANVGTNFPIRKGKDEIEDSDALWLEKAGFMAETKLGEFLEPFSPENIVVKNELKYCKGNNRLSYINLSYNNVAYLTLKKIINVLKYQKIVSRKPRGLVNICIEGNTIPSSCPELNQIDTILASYFTGPPKKMSVISNAFALKGRK